MLSSNSNVIPNSDKNTATGAAGFLYLVIDFGDPVADNGVFVLDTII